MTSTEASSNLHNAIKACDFERLITENSIVFVDFWASWCAPCKQFEPIYQKIAKKHPEITFITVDVEQESALAETFQIRSIPYLMVFKKGIAIYAESGTMPESTLEELVKQAIHADVSTLLAELDRK